MWASTPAVSAVVPWKIRRTCSVALGGPVVAVAPGILVAAADGEVVEFAEKRFAEIGKRVDFSLTTNATLLDEKTIAWLGAHRFGIAVSIDGPKAVHDRNRITVGGKGSYETVARKVRLLLGSYRARPVGARVTLTHGTTDVIGIWDHLFNELGFAEVGFAPVTAGDTLVYVVDILYAAPQSG